MEGMRVKRINEKAFDCDSIVMLHHYLKQLYSNYPAQLLAICTAATRDSVTKTIDIDRACRPIDIDSSRATTSLS